MVPLNMVPCYIKAVLLQSCCHRDTRKLSTCSLPPLHAYNKSYFVKSMRMCTNVLFKESVWQGERQGILARGKAVRGVSAFYQSCVKRKLAAGVFLTHLVL